MNATFSSGFNLVRRFSLLKSADVKKIRNPRGAVILRLGKTALLRPTEYVAPNAGHDRQPHVCGHLQGPSWRGSGKPMGWSRPESSSKPRRRLVKTGCRCSNFPLRMQFVCGCLPSGRMTDVLIRWHDEAAAKLREFNCRVRLREPASKLVSVHLQS